MSSEVDGTLDAFITHKVTEPEPIAVSQEIRDRGSTFVGHIFRCATLEQAKSRIGHLKHYVHRGQRKATHEIAAWRLMVLKPGKSGLEESADDFELVEGSKDDGESWAGGKVLKVMQNLAVIDAVVVVSRWYGGTLLGPARFQHIETCATDVCKAFKKTEELHDHIKTLRMLDEMLKGLRSKFDTLKEASSSEPKATSSESSLTPQSASQETSDDSRVPRRPDYTQLDISKAKRLINARENSIKTVTALIAKSEEKKPP